jgi:hypothetical protein
MMPGHAQTECRRIDVWLAALPNRLDAVHAYVVAARRAMARAAAPVPPLLRVAERHLARLRDDAASCTFQEVLAGWEYELLVELTFVEQKLLRSVPVAAVEATEAAASIRSAAGAIRGMLEEHAALSKALGDVEYENWLRHVRVTRGAA